MPYNVLIVTPFFFEPPRQKIGMRELAGAMARYGKVIVISSLIEGAEPYEQHGNLIIYRFRPWLYLRSVPYMIDPTLRTKIIRVARRENAHIIMAITVQFVSTWMAALARETLEIPLIVSIRGDRAAFRNPLLDLLPRLYDVTLGRWSTRRADRVICQTNAMRARAHQLGVPDERIIVLPQGVDTNRFRPGLDARSLREELDIPEGTPAILFVGNLYPRKGVHYLLDASESILKDHPDVVFILTGTGPSEQALKEQATRIDPSRFRFVGFRQDIPLLLSIASMLVLPSFREGLPQVILEAYACGVPVIATDVGGVKDVLRDGENGFLLPPMQSEAIVRAASNLLEDETLQAAIGATNRRIAVERYDLDKIARDTLDEMRQLGELVHGSQPS